MSIFPKKRPGHYDGVKSGQYAIGDRTIFFRSKMEANYALYLEFLRKKKEIVSWNYESKTFVFDKIMFGTRSYKPDFEVVRNSGKIEYHECKGFMDSKSRTKLKRMKKYYPDVKVVLIDNDQYRELKKWRSLLNFF